MNQLHYTKWCELHSQRTSQVRCEIHNFFSRSFYYIYYVMKSSSAGISKELWKPFVKRLVKSTVKARVRGVTLRAILRTTFFFSQRGCMVATFCATIHTMPSWTLKFASHYSTKCCRWCIHKEICCAQCCRNRTKFYCCNNAHYCSQNCRVDTQCNLAIVRNCIMYLSLN